MATARFDMRLDEVIKAKAEKAAILRGKGSLKEYIISLVEEDAPKAIAEHQAMVVEDDIFDRFMKACNAAKRPNKALIEAVRFTEDSGIK